MVRIRVRPGQTQFNKVYQNVVIHQAKVDARQNQCERNAKKLELNITKILENAKM